jgi:hypothetical protein
MRGLYGERRSRLRFSVELSGTVVGPFGISSDRAVSVRVKDVSFNGLLLELPHDVKTGEEVSLQVCFSGKGEKERMVSMAGTVVRCAKMGGERAPFMAGIRLKVIPPELKEGLMHLLPRRSETLLYTERELVIGE